MRLSQEDDLLLLVKEPLSYSVLHKKKVNAMPTAKISADNQMKQRSVLCNLEATCGRHAGNEKSDFRT